jgi:hypothetical protein
MPIFKGHTAGFRTGPESIENVLGYMFMNDALLGAHITIKLHIKVRFEHERATHYLCTGAALREVYVLFLIHP